MSAKPIDEDDFETPMRRKPEIFRIRTDLDQAEMVRRRHRESYDRKVERDANRRERDPKTLINPEDL